MAAFLTCYKYNISAWMGMKYTKCQGTVSEWWFLSAVVQLLNIFAFKVTMTCLQTRCFFFPTLHQMKDLQVRNGCSKLHWYLLVFLLVLINI